HAAVREAARVLSVGGRLCVCMTHPSTDAGHFEGMEPDARFVIDKPYLEARWIEDTCARDGLMMTFAGPAYPLQDYSRALEQAGFVIELIREPGIPVRRTPPDERWERMPLFMFLR